MHFIVLYINGIARVQWKLHIPRRKKADSAREELINFEERKRYVDDMLAKAKAETADYETGQPLRVYAMVARSAFPSEEEVQPQTLLERHSVKPLNITKPVVPPPKPGNAEVPVVNIKWERPPADYSNVRSLYKELNNHGKQG